MTKQQARKVARDRLAQMSENEKEWASGAIADALSGLDEYKRAHSIFVYLGTRSEPDTNEIVGLALMLEKVVCVPRINGESMDAVIISPYTNFRTNRWGISEPVGGQIAQDVDVAIIPLVAYDGLNRVGHGKGYYDRYLKSHDCFKIGLAFDCQYVSGLAVDDFDVPLDILITQNRIVDRNGECINEFGEKQ